MVLLKHDQITTRYVKKVGGKTFSFYCHKDVLKALGRWQVDIHPSAKPHPEGTSHGQSHILSGCVSFCLIFLALFVLLLPHLSVCCLQRRLVAMQLRLVLTCFKQLKALVTYLSFKRCYCCNMDMLCWQTWNADPHGVLESVCACVGWFLRC